MLDEEVYTDAFEALDAKQQRAVVELMRRPTIRDVATAVGVHETTIYRWLKDQRFAAAYRSARQQALSQATARLQTAASEAVATLERIATNRKAPASSQVAAANHILTWAYRADTFEELSAMLDELQELSDE